MNRKVVKSEYATIKIPEVDLEIPPQTQKGKLSTIEGFILNTKENIEKTLNDGQYNEFGEEFMVNIKNFINKLDKILNHKSLPIHFIIDDPSGNSFIENPYAPTTDPNATITNYIRTTDQLKTMGIYHEETNNEPNLALENQIKSDFKHSESKKKIQHVYSEQETKMLFNKASEMKKKSSVYKSDKISAHLIDFTKSIENNEDIEQDCLVFQANCFACTEPGENRMCICTIPYFKEIIITCFKCDKCGFKTAEVKGGGGFSDKATKLVLRKQNVRDLCRDVFKSETAKITIPELEFETDTGSMGGMFTTVEGILTKIYDNLANIPFSFGDSREDSKMADFLIRFKRLLTEDINFTLIIDDPLSNSFIFSELTPKKDPQLDIIEYERTWEQNEELGINDINVDNYQSKKEESNSQNIIEESKEV